MLDQMTMPVLFAILIGFLALITVGTLVVFRIIGDRTRGGGRSTRDEPPSD